MTSSQLGLYPPYETIGVRVLRMNLPDLNDSLIAETLCSRNGLGG